jgi:hypothetical protein
MPSKAGLIADAAVAGVNALALSGAPTAVKRKRPSLPQGTEPPQIVVCVQRRGPTEYLDNAHDMRTYEGQVAVITAGGELEGDDDTLRGWCESIAGKLEAWATWTGTVTTFNDVRLGELIQYDRAAGGKTLNYAVQRFTIESKEPR